jgi:23S rRNA pseudouridine1911/1915/1917 synthase
LNLSGSTDLDGIRLDQYVTHELGELSRASSAKLIESGKVKVNNKVQTKSSFHLKDSDKVKINYKPQIATKIESIELEVIYEDEDCVVINKPAGILSHSKGEFNPEATVATWLGERATEMSGDRAGIVHRLDRLTSGVMIVAKNQEAMKWLQKQFSTRKVKKTYIAIIAGELNPSEAVIDMPIERNPKKPQTFRAGVNGKSASTLYKVIKSNDKYSMVELQPKTGRTHQLRVHLKQIGHPIVGDSLYGGKEAERMYLHAKSLELTLPNKERKIFETPLPNVFDKLLK